MAKRSYEAIIGVVNHAPFGPGIVVGSGGTLVELLADTAFDLAPLDLKRAAQLISETKFGTLIKGFRGGPVGDAEALASTVSLVSEIALTYRDELEALDLDPVSVRETGKGVLVLDALVIQKTLKNKGSSNELSNNHARDSGTGGNASPGASRQDERAQ